MKGPAYYKDTCRKRSKELCHTERYKVHIIMMLVREALSAHTNCISGLLKICVGLRFVAKQALSRQEGCVANREIDKQKNGKSLLS